MIAERDRVICSQALEVDALKKQVEAMQRELDRWRHGATVEGDFVCPNELELQRWRDVLPIDKLLAAREGSEAAKARGEIDDYSIIITPTLDVVIQVSTP